MDGDWVKVIGLMSGTSVDGVDAAVVEVAGAPPELSVRVLGFGKTAFPEGLRGRVFELFEGAVGPGAVSIANVELGELFARAALEAAEAAGVGMGQIDLVASHGQTVYHGVGPEEAAASTLQIGEAAVIAERTGVTTLADFRPRDVAAGGQGAPLVSFVDYLLFRDERRGRAVQNLGGIGNVTGLPPAATPEHVIAFDTGPGNMLIDFAAETVTQGGMRYDQDGLMARRGGVNGTLLDWLMGHPFLGQRPPKTAGREQFGRHFGREVLEVARDQGVGGDDLVATLTAFTAASVARAYAEFLPFRVDEAILGGGGSYNPTLVEMLSQRLAPARVLRHEDFGLSSDAKEAVAFAVLGYEALHGRPNTLPACTGASHAVVMGKIVPGRNYRALMRMIHGEAWGQGRQAS